MCFQPIHGRNVLFSAQLYTNFGGTADKRFVSAVHSVAHEPTKIHLRVSNCIRNCAHEHQILRLVQMTREAK